MVNGPGEALPVRLTVLVLHTVESDELAPTPEGGASLRTMTVVLPEKGQPDPVPVTVYAVLIEGDAVTEAPVVALRPDAGLQV